MRVARPVEQHALEGRKPPALLAREFSVEPARGDAGEGALELSIGAVVHQKPVEGREGAAGVAFRNSVDAGEEAVENRAAGVDPIRHREVASNA